MKKYIAAILIVLYSISGIAQADSLTNAYIENFPNKVSAQVFLLNTSNDFTLRDRAEKIRLDLVPNHKTTLNVGLQYDIVAISFGFAPKFFADNRDRTEGSKMNAFSIDVFPGRFMQHFDFYYQKGLNVKDDGRTIVYFPEMKTLKAGGSTSYIFNKNFSFRALSFQSERQLKSAGSFAPALSYYYTELNGNKVEGINSKTYFIDVALAPAYNYNWVIAENFLVAGGASLGGGFTRAIDEDGNYTAFLTQAAVSISLGYNSDTFYGGVYSKGTLSNHRSDSSAALDDIISYATAFLGYRFDAPSFLQEEREKIKQRL